MQVAARRTTGLRETRKIGPSDAGRRFTWEDFCFAEFEEGFRCELIDGRLIVAAMPNPKHSGIAEWLYGALRDYGRKHPGVLNHLSIHCEVVIPGRPEITAPHPDIAAYVGFPVDKLDDEDLSWREIAPLLVIEIVSPDSADKDSYRNVALYELETSIREYWICDPRESIRKPTLRVYRRRGNKWQKPIDVVLGEVYATKLLPGFCLKMNPLT